MKFISLLIASIILSACAATDENKSSSNQSSGLNPNIQSNDEINQFKKATKLLNNNKLDAAKELFLSLKNDRPELAGPYANLAIIALKNNKPAVALDLVNKSLVKNPNLPQALNLLAYLEQIRGEFKAAESNYKKAIENKPNYSIAYYNLALLYDIYLQDIEKAIPYYELYMELTNNEDKKTADWLEQIKRTKGNS